MIIHIPIPLFVAFSCFDIFCLFMFFVVFLAPYLSTFFACIAIGISRNCIWGKDMATLTLISSHYHSHVAIAPSNVFKSGYWLKMVWIYTATYAALMVKLFSFWYWADEVRVGNPMYSKGSAATCGSEHGLITENATIAIFLAGSHPYPTSTIRFWGNKVEDSIYKWSTRSHSQGSISSGVRLEVGTLRVASPRLNTRAKVIIS